MIRLTESSAPKVFITMIRVDQGYIRFRRGMYAAFHWMLLSTAWWPVLKKWKVSSMAKTVGPRVDEGWDLTSGIDDEARFFLRIIRRLRRPDLDAVVKCACKVEHTVVIDHPWIWGILLTYWTINFVLY